ncbi:hypothetical protein FKM82_024608, partial [Ascaphus truei]
MQCRGERARPLYASLTLSPAASGNASNDAAGSHDATATRCQMTPEKGYALLHASRKSFSNVKVSISSQWTPSSLNTSVYVVEPNQTWNSNHLFPDKDSATLFLGLLDTIFLFSYAVGLFVSGIVGDRLNMRLVLTFGMCSSAVVVRSMQGCYRGVCCGANI